MIGKVRENILRRCDAQEERGPDDTSTALSMKEGFCDCARDLEVGLACCATPDTPNIGAGPHCSNYLFITITYARNGVTLPRRARYGASTKAIFEGCRVGQ